MRVVTKQEVGEAIQVHGMDGTSYAALNGHWLVNIEGKPSTIALSDEEYRARFQSAETHTTGRRTTRTAKVHKTEIPTLTKTAQEALTVIARAHKALNAKTLAREIGADPKSTKAALSELKSAGAIQHHGRGTWVAVNGARA